MAPGEGRGRQSKADEKLSESTREEEGDDDSEETEESEDDNVAYLEDPPTEEEARLLTRWMFPSKVYASKGSVNPDAFHRSLMVFVCTSCQPNEVRVFRSQLPWKNDFYSSERPDPEQIAARLRKSGNADAELDPLICGSCGLPRSPCSGSGKASSSGAAGNCWECTRRARHKDPPAVFQERELSTYDAEVPEDDEVPPAGGTDDDDVEEVFTDGARAARGGGRDLVAEADAVLVAAKSKGASAAVLEKLEAYKARVTEDPEHAIDASEQAVFDNYSKEQGEYDPVFAKFNRYAAANNGHVLRYTQYDGKPLWFCEHEQMQDKPPDCPLCGGPRDFEFQVQPMLISHLRNTSDVADRLDFGAIFVYTCRGSCTPSADKPYAEEFAFVQAEPREAWLPKA